MNNFDSDYYLNNQLNEHYKSLEVSETENAKNESLNILSDLFPILEDLTSLIDNHIDPDLAYEVEKAYVVLDKLNTKLKTL